MLRYRHKLVPNVSELPSEMSKLLYDVGKVLKFSRQNSKITTATFWPITFSRYFYPSPLGGNLKTHQKSIPELCFIIILKYFFIMMVFTKKLPFFSSCLFTFLTVLLLPLFFHYFSTQRPLNNRLPKNKMVVQY